MWMSVAVGVVALSLAVLHVMRGSASLYPPPRRVLLVIAHPDDESMFFVPAIRALQIKPPNARALESERESEREPEIRILCLSTGNYAGLGARRCSELIAAAHVLGINADRVHFPRVAVAATAAVTAAAGGGMIEFDELLDGPKEVWAADAVLQTVNQFVARYQISDIITFDAGGVSGHTNHIALHSAIQSLVRSQPQSAATTRVCAYQLATDYNPIRKYGGTLSAALIVLYERYASPSPSRRVLLPIHAFDVLRGLSHRAMIAHWSQYVWYRLLFVLFSQYTYLNILTPIE